MSNRFNNHILSLAELDQLPDLKWLIHGVLPSNSLCVLYGEPGCGKSFIALSIALVGSTGNEWLGKQTCALKTLYIAAEGVLGSKYRVRAHRKRHPVNQERVYLFPAAIQVTDKDAREHLSENLSDKGFTPDLIIVDTLARVAIGADENSSRDMGGVIAAVDEIRKEFQCTILLVHHTRKNGGAERGSSAIRGAADVMIECKASEKFERMGKLTCSKMKDAEPFEEIEFGMEKVDLGGGANSLLVGPCPPILKRVPKARSDERISDSEVTILKILVDHFGLVGATHGELKTAWAESNSGSDSKFDRALRNLLKRGEIRKEGGGKGALYLADVVGVTSVSSGGVG